MRLKIISDGTVWGTEIIDVTTGDSINNVLRATYFVSVDNFESKGELHIVIDNVECEIETDNLIVKEGKLQKGG